MDLQYSSSQSVIVVLPIEDHCLQGLLLEGGRILLLEKEQEARQYWSWRRGQEGTLLCVKVVAMEALVHRYQSLVQKFQPVPSDP